MSTTPEAGAGEANVDEHRRKMESLYNSLSNDGKVVAEISKSLLDAQKRLAYGFARTMLIEDTEFQTELEMKYMRAIHVVEDLFSECVKHLTNNVPE